MKEDALPSAVPLMTTAEITLEAQERRAWFAIDLHLVHRFGGGKKYILLDRPENKHVLQPLVANQIASVCEGSGVRHEDDTLGETKADAVDVGSLLGGFVRKFELPLI